MIADSLSQSIQPITKQWSLHTEIVTQIFGTWGTPTVGMFATVHKTHLPQFIDLIHEPHALAIDALSQESGEVCVHVSTVPPAQQGHSETKNHPGWRSGGHNRDFHIYYVFVWTTPSCHNARTYCHNKGISSGQSYHLQAWRLSGSTTQQQDFQEVFRLIAAFRRRPSTNNVK